MTGRWRVMYDSREGIRWVGNAWEPKYVPATYAIEPTEEAARARMVELMPEPDTQWNPQIGRIWIEEENHAA